MADITVNGVPYFRAYFECPVCRERGLQAPQTYWSHGTDDGDIYIGSDAKYYCSKCEKNSHVMKWEYKCPIHSTSDDDYVGVGDIAVIAEVIGTCMSLVQKTGLAWMRELLKNLENGQ